MLPARRNKVDISVRTLFQSQVRRRIFNRTSRHDRMRSGEDISTQKGVDQRLFDFISTGYVPGGAEALSSLWQAPHSQECVE